MVPHPIRFGISLECGDSNLERESLIRVAAQAGFEDVHLIEPTPSPFAPGDRSNVSVIHGNAIVAATHQLMQRAVKQRTLVGIGPLCGTEEDVASHVAMARAQLGDLMAGVELAFSFLQVSIDDPTDLSVLHHLMPSLPETQIRRFATVLDGSIGSAASRIREFHEELGISYFTFHKSLGTTWNTLASLVNAVE